MFPRRNIATKDKTVSIKSNTTDVQSHRDQIVIRQVISEINLPNLHGQRYVAPKQYRPQESCSAF